MKVRQGFVSNSSTASFVICGFKIEDTIENKKMIGQKVLGLTMEHVIQRIERSSSPEDVNDPEQIDAWYDDLFFDAKQQPGDIFVLDGEGVEALIVGKLLAYGDDLLSNEEIDIEELREIVQEARAKAGCEDIPIKLYTGTKCC